MNIPKDVIEHAKVLRDYLYLDQSIQKSDIAIVFWSQSIKVAEKGIKLYKDWYVSKILFTWWLWKYTKSDKRFTNSSEAETFKQIALQQWIPTKDIITENKSTNTWENIEYSKQMIKALSIEKNHIILVQKPYSQRRVFFSFLKQRDLPLKKVSIISPKRTMTDYLYNIDLFIKVINIMVWEINKLIEYPKKWYTIHQEIPEKILASYFFLIDQWFCNMVLRKSILNNINR